MATLQMTVFGFLFSIVLCSIMKVSFMLGYGEPNVITAEGETYLGWWLMLFFTTGFAGTLAGMVIDTVATIYNWARS